MSENKPIRPTVDHGVSEGTELPNVGKKNEGEWTKKIGIGFFALILLYLLGNVFFSKDKETVVLDEKLLAQEKIRPNYIAKNPEQNAASPVNTVSGQAETTQSNVAENPDLQKMRLAYMEQQIKVFQVRQKAPISFWEGKHSSVPQQPQAVMNQNVTNGMNNHQLPLSSAQIDALKKAQSGDSNSEFQSRAENSEVSYARATLIPYRDETITQGTMISGVLQTAINSDLPGQIKANVSEDVYGSTGEKLLIPKGSQLIGQYNSGIGLGQKRVFAMWTRLIRPDGVSVMLGSPGTDSLGTAGIGADVLQTHFWERFGQTTLLSIVAAGVANVGVPEDDEYNSASQYRMMISQNFQQSANGTLSQTMNQKPTIYIYQGDKIKVFVNRDLSFHEINE